jgi:uncharacterized protein
MNVTESRPESPAAPLGPVLEQERLVTLDVLRGLALLGVVIANVWLWFSGIAFRFPGYQQELRQISLDSAVFFGIAVLVSGKAISTFSFLFGHGFAIQMLRARARARSVVPVYARRLTLLLLIGVAHMVVLWYGDILTIYAVLGFILLLFRNRADRTLLVWAAILVGAVPVLMGAVPWILSGFGVALPQPNLTEIAQRNATTLAVFQGGRLAEILRENLHQAGKFYLGRKAPQVLYLLGLFVFGLFVGRRGVFEDVAAHRAVFRRIVAWGIPVGLTGSIAIAVLQATLAPDVMLAQPPLALLITLLFIASTVPLAAAYVSAVALLLQNPAFARRLSVFAPVGRMALTNYLTQTLVMLLIFYPYGAGLIGRTGPAIGLVIALGLFAVQMVWSQAWLTRFQFGPMEWVWRSLTYGAPQPMMISRALVGVAAVTKIGA